MEFLLGLAFGTSIMFVIFCIYTHKKIEQAYMDGYYYGIRRTAYNRKEGDNNDEAYS
jgi:hypothetical protein